MCSAADDPSLHDGDHFAYPNPDEHLENFIARRNIAWAKWQDEADELVHKITDGEHAPYGPYNEAQKAYEHRVSELMRAQARWRHDRHA
jgi:hypothetical protein